MSAESGIQTFRGNGGLWEGYEVTKVATPEAWEADPALVLEFYNMRRKNVLEAQPNAGHKLLAELERDYEVHIVTQNIDDVHERAGSTQVTHLHGEITKARSSIDPNLIYTLDKPTIELGEVCALGSQLRPHIVWFGEDVPMLYRGAELVSQADYLIVVGTSMNVYPAAGLTAYAPQHSPIFLVDPNPNHESSGRFTHIVDKASTGIQKCLDLMA